MVTSVRNMPRAKPVTPRVVLLGPTGSGKSLQAAQLANKYNLVDVDCALLVKQTRATGSKVALTMKPFKERSMLSELEYVFVCMWSMYVCAVCMCVRVQYVCVCAC